MKVEIQMNKSSKSKEQKSSQDEFAVLRQPTFSCEEKSFKNCPIFVCLFSSLLQMIITTTIIIIITE